MQIQVHFAIHHIYNIFTGFNAWLSNEVCRGYRWRIKAYLVSIKRRLQGAIRSIERSRRNCFNWSRSELEVGVLVVQQFCRKFQFQGVVKIDLDLLIQEEFWKSKGRFLLYSSRCSRSTTKLKQGMFSSL